MVDRDIQPDYDDELDVDELEEVSGGIVAGREDCNAGCTINGNCGC
ncbi:MAG TPA: hypothetical protein VHG08_22085 [Longimicrobium sp.]|nr:hypothetical protein [Longimicrobium sp.]